MGRDKNDCVYDDDYIYILLGEHSSSIFSSTRFSHLTQTLFIGPVFAFADPLSPFYRHLIKVYYPYCTALANG